MDKAISRDATPIAYARSGTGQPLIFVVGAFNDHTRCQPLADALAVDFSVITYDRRGRGESGDSPAYAIDREVEDLAALIDVAGGQAAVFGYSSGGVLALRAAADGLAITRLVLFEAPFKGAGTDLPERLAELVRQGRRGDAVELFQTEGIGLPAPVVAQIKRSPMWPALEAMAQSTVYDATITSELAGPTPAMAAVTTPTLVLTGAGTWPVLAESAAMLVKTLPDARPEELPGAENHDIPVDATAAALREFLR